MANKGPTVPKGLRRPRTKNSGHAPGGYKGSGFRVSCVNLECDRRQDPSGAADKDRSIPVGLKRLPKCPKCGAEIPRNGYVTSPQP